MTNSTKPTSSKAPSHIAFHVRDNSADKAFWTRVGAAWANADGKGFNIQLDCVPLDGRITLRILSEQSE